MFDLSGRVAVVTGGNGGIGRGIALGFAEAGAAVAIMARSGDKNRAALADLRALGVPALALSLDVTDRAALQPALEEVERTLGAVDILVNNAGISWSGPTPELDVAAFDQLFTANVRAPSRSVVPLTPARGTSPNSGHPHVQVLRALAVMNLRPGSLPPTSTAVPVAAS
jgi:2-deoxy-D-gluconate 3-dehydrogenase